METTKLSLPFEVDIRLNARRTTILDGIAIDHYDRRPLHCLLRYRLMHRYLCIMQRFGRLHFTAYMIGEKIILKGRT